MATIPTPEESGRKILEEYKRDNRRAGEMMLLQGITARLMKRGERSEDIKSGLQWLVNQGYLEQKREKLGMFFLTESGFTEL